ncbi:hypothetical protein CSUNSWCD_2038 [Campylobacter showae CSUNSWCD]|uniref:Uncharacterized protein n=1 Tax=Campylobacter showae CSUNSWCD TaxID=1244083 RepID=M5IG28_9BACT|nr:hypothetical protein CSUNSWCD_2038 [Campylobacter showae CSUNSWCD]
MHFRRSNLSRQISQILSLTTKRYPSAINKQPHKPCRSRRKFGVRFVL